MIRFDGIDRSLLHEYNSATNELNPNPHKFKQRQGWLGLCNSNISPDCYGFKQLVLSRNILREEIVVLPAGKRSAAGELNPKTRLNDDRCDRDGSFIDDGMVKDFCDGIWN